jgi:hypothetical protein
MQLKAQQQNDGFHCSQQNKDWKATSPESGTPLV